MIVPPTLRYDVGVGLLASLASWILKPRPLFRSFHTGERSEQSDSSPPSEGATPERPAKRSALPSERQRATRQRPAYLSPIRTRSIRFAFAGTL